MQNTADLTGRIMQFEYGIMTADEIVRLFQDLIDTGIVWSLQGTYGRMAKRMIDLGYCKPKGN